MESNNNCNNEDGGDEQQQPLRRSVRKRKLNELANDGKPVGGEEDQPAEEDCSSNTKCEGKNDRDLEQIVQLPQVTGDGEKEVADENEEQAQLPMKIQLSKETWFDMFGFVGRYELGQIVPQVGDRRFAEIAQSFLHNYGRITLPDIYISTELADRLVHHAAAIPENVKDFHFISLSVDDFDFEPSEIALLNRWLHTPRDDGKPRVLILPVDYSEVRAIDRIPHFIDGTIKLEFAAAKSPACFFIRLFVYDTVDWHDSSMENGETKEKLVIKNVATSRRTNGQKMALVSRYPLSAHKQWIEANEREAIDWDFDEQTGRIRLATLI